MENKVWTLGMTLKKATVVVGLLLSVVFTGSACAQQTHPQAAVTDFQKFWTQFRAAVLAKDSAKVTLMTRFPFTTRGPLDSDPVITHDKDSFLRIWDQLLTQDPGLSPKPDTMRHLIEKKTTITNKDITVSGSTHSGRVGDFIFTKVQGKWLLTHAYLNNDDIGVKS